MNWKKLFFGTFLSIFVLLFFFIRPIRTPGVMEEIARGELESILYDEFGEDKYKDILNQLCGPVVRANKKEHYVEYSWYKKINQKDTACIYIHVCTSSFSVPFIEFVSHGVTANNNWEKL